MTGVLKARVNGAWVDILGVTGAPAYVGPRRDSNPAHAQFGHVNETGSGNGLIVPGDGSMYTLLGSGKTHYLYAGLVLFGSIKPNELYIDPWKLGMHSSGSPGLWRANGAAGSYVLTADGNTYLNADAAKTLLLRVGNADRITADTDVHIPSGVKLKCEDSTFTPKVVADGQIQAYGGSPNETYTSAHFFANSSGGPTTRLAMNHPGVAPQLRANSADGERLGAVNNPGTAFVSFKGTAYVDVSTATIKRSIRTLRKGAQRERVRHDPMTDTLAEPNVMALRPVVYRPEVPAMRLVERPDWDGAPEDPERWESCEQPPDSPLGVQGNRERLGLIAEDVQHVMPSAVQYDAEGRARGIHYTQITVALLDHVQQLTRTIETMQYRITELEAARG